MELELSLEPEQTGRLSRLPLLAPLRRGRARSRAVRIIWHDGADRALARDGLALAEQRPQWRLERLQPNGESWPPGAPAPVLATGRDPAVLGLTLPDPLLPMAALAGRAAQTELMTEQGPVELTLLHGVVRAVADEHRISRIRLSGAAAAVEPLALALCGELRVSVPRASLPAEALSLAFGMPPPARRLGAPDLPTGLSVPAALTHVVGHLSDVILHFAPGAASGQEGPEPVHQMRVAVRRLRSAIKVFRHSVMSPAVDAADAGLKMLAGKLAPTRDWDVFVTETAVAVTAAFPAELRLQRLLAAAERRRNACHEELRSFLDSAEFRRLGIQLACLASGEGLAPAPEDATTDELPEALQDFANRVLGKRLKKLTHIDDDLLQLEPMALHAIRLRAKRMRYAAEVFAPLYPGKSGQRFIRRLSRLQDRLGALNDGAVAANLLAELSSGNHAFATGLVIGFIGAGNGDTRERIEQAWQRFRRTEPFWA